MAIRILRPATFPANLIVGKTLMDVGYCKSETSSDHDSGGFIELDCRESS
ncbi:hypothetical protein WN51_11814 [Melipona quadrifasciata]|uniref:Uncharacterized protein n=1 Tax=Melipona quadrifasciata TaxID=166423 RepID=A0A0M9A573_9HYME|nr:hypothetical protein WN51_11814 [Melipona quadrifasciata]